MVDLKLVKLLFDRTTGVCPYKLGAKWPLGADSSACRGKPVDCSGYVRWILDRAGVRLPDGSQKQWAYVRDVLGWREVNYKDIKYTEADPSRLFIAFKRAGRSTHGHVWLVNAGHTMESCSSGGVCRRPWKRLERYASGCFEVPTPARES